MEDPDEERSYFTKALLEGLEGQAARNGRIDSNTLSDYVVGRVKVLTKDKRKPQEPQMVGEPGSPIVFRDGLDAAAVANAKTHKVLIKLPAGFAGKAVLQDGNLKEIARHSAADGSWELKLTNSLYAVVDLAGQVQFKNEGTIKVWGEDRDVQL